MRNLKHRKLAANQVSAARWGALRARKYKTWWEGDKVRKRYLGSCKKLDADAALEKARKMMAEALGVEGFAVTSGQ